MPQARPHNTRWRRAFIGEFFFFFGQRQRLLRRGGGGALHAPTPSALRSILDLVNAFMKSLANRRDFSPSYLVIESSFATGVNEGTAADRRHRLIVRRRGEVAVARLADFPRTQVWPIQSLDSVRCDTQPARVEPCAICACMSANEQTIQRLTLRHGAMRRGFSLW